MEYQPGQLLQTADSYVFEVIEDKGGDICVTPAWGYPLHYGDKEGELYWYRRDLLFPVPASW